MNEAQRKAFVADLLGSMRAKVDAMTQKIVNGQDVTVEKAYINMYWNQIQALDPNEAE